jgi:hypothetical protein
MKRTYFVLISLFLIGSSSSVQAADVYFRLDDRSVRSIDENTLSASLAPDGLLAVLLQRRGTMGIGSGESKKDAIELKVNARTFKKYILEYLRYGTVEFPNSTSAMNALKICEYLGLASAQQYIENYIATHSISSANKGYHLLSSLLMNRTSDDLIAETAESAVAAALTNNVEALKTIYEEIGVIDINLLIPFLETGGLQKQSFNGKWGSPILSFAASAGNLEAVEYLLSQGANPTLRSRYETGGKNTVMEWAEASRNASVMRAIREAISEHRSSKFEKKKK